MLDHATAFDDLDAHVLPTPGRGDPASGQPLHGHAWRPDRADTSGWRPKRFGAGSRPRDSVAQIRPTNPGCLLGFPETPHRIHHAGDRVALLSALIVVCDASNGPAGFCGTRSNPAGGLWVELPRRARTLPDAVASSTLAAWLPRDLFVAQRLLFCRMRHAAGVEADEAVQQLEALGRRVAFVDLDACDLASAELVSPIAEGLGEMPERAAYVERVRRAAGISRRSVFRAFRQRVGMSAHQLGMELRVRRAFDLLCHRAVPIGGIVAQLGYASQSHFCSHFKAAFGISPGRLQDALDDPLRLRDLRAVLSPRPIDRPASASSQSGS